MSTGATCCEGQSLLLHEERVKSQLGGVGRCCGAQLVPTDRSATWKQEATGREVGAAERGDFTPGAVP